MKNKILYLVTGIVMLSLLVSPVSATWPFDDVITAINESIIPWLSGFISSLIGVLVPIAMFLLYPVILMLNLLYNNINLICTTGASVLNIFLGIPNFISAMLTAWLPTSFPSVWTVLFLMSISLSVFARTMRIMNYLKSWIPILFG